jgi:hypothetical protein
LGAEIITSLNIPTTPGTSSSVDCSKDCDDLEGSGSPKWYDSYLSDASFQAIPKEVPPTNIFHLTKISSSISYKSSTLQSLIYQAVYNTASELPTDLTCKPVYASFYSTPSIPDYCFIPAKSMPASNHSLLITLSPTTTKTPPIVATYRQGSSSLDEIVANDNLLTAKIVMPSLGTWFAVDTMKGEVVAGINNDTSVDMYLNPTWPSDHAAAKFLTANFPKAALITTNGMVGPDTAYTVPTETDDLDAEWDNLAMPHFSVTLQSGECVVNGLDQPLVIAHDGPLSTVQIADGSVSSFSAIFPSFAAWKKVNFDASVDQYEVHSSGGHTIYAIPFTGLEVGCDSFQEEVEDIVASFVAEKGYSPYSNSAEFSEKYLRGFKVHSDATSATRVVYLGLNVHSRMDPSGDVEPPSIVGKLGNLRTTASAVRDFVVGEDESALGSSFDSCFAHVCAGKSCHAYSNYAKERDSLEAEGRTLETKLEVCTRCSVLNLDGVPKATIPWIDSAGQLTKASCDDFFVFDAPTTRARRELLELPQWVIGFVYDEERYGPWHGPVTSYLPDEMPAYNQFEYNSPNGWGGTCAVGCGPVAWAQLMAWGERTWGSSHGFIAPEYGSEMPTILCNDWHDDEGRYPFESASDRAWPWECRGGTEWSAGVDCSDPLKHWDDPNLVDCNAAGDVVNDRIVQLNEAMGTWCLGSGGATSTWQMDNALGLYASWHVPFHTQSLTTVHNTLMWGGGWPLPSWKNKYLRRQVNAGRPAIGGFRSSFWGQHYGVIQQYVWRTYTRCLFGNCVRDSYKYEYFINMGWGGADNGWYDISAWLAGWIDSKDDDRSEEMYFAWLWCCEWKLGSEGACSIDCDNYSPPDLD